jgi:hypothetical protein
MLLIFQLLMIQFHFHQDLLDLMKNYFLHLQIHHLPLQNEQDHQMMVLVLIHQDFLGMVMLMVYYLMPPQQEQLMENLQKHPHQIHHQSLWQ